MAGVQVGLQGQGEVVRQDEVSVSNSIHGVTDGLILVQLALPHEMTVYELVTGVHHLTIYIDI